MSKPEWGTKRICQSCATKFYDFGRTPITCPKCSAVFDPETLLKSRRNRPAASPKSSKPIAPTKPQASDDGTGKAPKGDTLDGKTPDGKTPDGKTPDGKTPDGKTPDGKTPDGKTPEDNDESAIEDASELGEDDEAVSKEIVPSKSGEN